MTLVCREYKLVKDTDEQFVLRNTLLNKSISLNLSMVSKHLPQNAERLKATITKTRLFKYTENFTTKQRKFSDKNSDFFFLFLLKTDCGYSLEPPRRGGSNEYPQSMF